MKVKKNKHGDYERHVVFEVFSRYRVHVIFSEDIRKSCTKRYGYCDVDNNADAFCKRAIDGRMHMFLPLNVPEGNVAHEAWHVIHEIFDYTGVIKFENEVVAYHLGYLVEQIHKFKNEVENVISGVR